MLPPDDNVDDELPRDIKRKLLQVFRNAILESINKQLCAIVMGWFPRHNRLELIKHLEIDRANFDKWEFEGQLSLRMLLDILIRCGKDFTDLVNQEREKLLSPARINVLKTLGLRAVLLENFKRKKDASKDLKPKEALILLQWHIAGRWRDPSWTWLFPPRRALRPAPLAARIRGWLEELGIASEELQKKRLEELRNDWIDVVPDVSNLLSSFVE